ncbi:hypothetical protein Q604_UNBC07096G0001, partial [human gut metagenome]
MNLPIVFSIFYDVMSRSYASLFIYPYMRNRNRLQVVAKQQKRSAAAL